MKIGFVLLVFSACGILNAAETSTNLLAPGGSFAITHVRLFDGERTLQDQTIIVRESTTVYEIVADGANGTKKALRIIGDIVSGLPCNWAGAMFSPGARPFAPANLSKTRGIQFWAKGDGKTYRLIYFTAGSGNIPQVTTFVAGENWKRYSIPFSTFGDSDGHDVAAILFTGGPEAGKFDFQIDEVGLVSNP